MIEISVNKFRANIKTFVDKVLSEHSTIRVKRRAGQDFVVQSAEDWEREQETLLVLQSKSLSKQIKESIKTHKNGRGYSPAIEELDEINRI